MKQKKNSKEMENNILKYKEQLEKAEKEDLRFMRIIKSVYLTFSVIIICGFAYFVYLIKMIFETIFFICAVVFIFLIIYFLVSKIERRKS